MDTDLNSILETIKNRELHQASKIKNLESKIESLTSYLEKNDQIWKKKLLQKNEETRLLSLELQQQASKIKDFECKIETITSCLTDSEKTNQILKVKLLQKKEETRILTVKLQQQMGIIEAINRNIENFHASNAALQQELSGDGNRVNFSEKGSFILLNAAAELTRNNHGVVSQFENLLSQLSSDNYDKNALKINKLPFHTFEQMKKCVEILFEKIISEPHIPTIYVELCQLLSTRYVILENAGEISVTFRNLLTIHCMNEFEDSVRALQSEKRDVIIHERAVRTVRLVGNLYNGAVLTFKNMFQYLNLLSSSDDNLLECLSELLTCIGKEIELDRRNCLSLLFVKLKSKLASDDNSLCPRIRMMLQTVIELRHNNWQHQEQSNDTQCRLESGSDGIILKYNADQWSPDFQEGRKYYTYEQLTTLSKAPAALQKPEGLPDVVLSNEQHRLPIYNYEWKTTLMMVNSFGALLETLNQENFDAVTSKAIDCVNNDCQRAAKFVKKLLGQAVAKPEQCELYAKFAKRVCAEKGGFKKMLIYICKEMALLNYAANGSNPEPVTEDTFDYRLKPLLVFKLIAQLFRIGQLQVEILNDYIHNLLESSNDANLIFLCEQLANNGRHIERANSVVLNEYFVKLNAIALNSKTSEAVQSAIQDLFVLRQNNWST